MKAWPALMLVLMLSGCRPGEAPIKLVSSLPLAGVSRRQSQSMVNAFAMAVDEAGQGVEYDSWNDAVETGWDAGREERNARRAAADPDVCVYLGPYNSGAAEVAIPILNRAGVVVVSPANTYTGLTRAGPSSAPGEPEAFYPTGIRTYCRLIPNDDVTGAAAAAWAASLGVHSVYVVHEKDDFGRGLAQTFSAQCRVRGLQVLATDGVSRSTADLRACVERIRRARPGLVYYGGITENGAGALVRGLREADVDALFMGPGGIKESAFIREAGEASDGAYATLGIMPLSKLPVAAKEWYDRYRLRYRDEPEPYAIYAYEAARVALQAVARVGRKDRSAIRQAVMATRDYHGVLGTWSFDSQGDTTIRTVSGYQVRHYAFQFVRLLEP